MRDRANSGTTRGRTDRTRSGARYHAPPCRHPIPRNSPPARPNDTAAMPRPFVSQCLSSCAEVLRLASRPNSGDR